MTMIDDPAIIEITDENREATVELFRMALDEDGYVLDPDTGERIECPYTNEPVNSESMAILPVDEGGQAFDGTALFVNAEPLAYAMYIAEHGFIGEDAQ